MYLSRVGKGVAVLNGSIHLGCFVCARLMHKAYAAILEQVFNKDSAEFPHLLGGGMNAVQALACWLMEPLHYRPLLVLYTA